MYCLHTDLHLHLLGTFPAEMVLRRSLGTRLDLLRPDYINDLTKRVTSITNFEQGDNVWTCIFDKDTPWIPAKIVSPI